MGFVFICYYSCDTSFHHLEIGEEEIRAPSSPSLRRRRQRNARCSSPSFRPRLLVVLLAVLLVVLVVLVLLFPLLFPGLMHSVDSVTAVCRNDLCDCS